VRRLSRRLGMETPTITPQALDLLKNFPFPGNVRELENVLERAMALCNQGRIDAGDLQLRAVPRAEGAAPLAPDAIAQLRVAGMPNNPLPADAASRGALGEQLEDVERAAIMKALEQARYNKTAAAKALGMTFRALRYRIKKLGIE
jgi:two-component system response regulator PilR (NtrC family)